jgi:hypothetical protein
VGQIGLVGRRLVIASGRVRRGEDEPSRPRQARGIENPERLADVDRERPEGIVDRVGNPRSRGEVDDRIGPRDGPGDRVDVRQPGLDELVGDAVEVGEVADREVVENPDPGASLDKKPADRRADEAGSADDEDGPVQRRDAWAVEPASAIASGTQRTFWTNVALSIRSRCPAIRSSIVSISSSLSSRG